MNFNELIAGAQGATFYDPVPAIMLAAILLLGIAHVFASIRLARFMKGANAKSLEAFIRTLDTRVGAIESEMKQLERRLDDANNRIKRNVRSSTLKRYDPFGARHGEQSFSTALLDEEGNGIVVTGIHARDGVRVYAKEVSHFASTRELSEEERSAIDSTRKNV